VRALKFFEPDFERVKREGKIMSQIINNRIKNTGAVNPPLFVSLAASVFLFDLVPTHGPSRGYCHFLHAATLNSSRGYGKFFTRAFTLLVYIISIYICFCISKD